MARQTRKDSYLWQIGFPVKLADYKAKWSGDIPESQFPANGVLLDVDDVSETAATATGIALEEAEIYDELLTPSALMGDVLAPANGDYYSEKKDKLIPKQLNAYKFYREIQSNKQHQLKKQMTVNYFRPFEKENIALDYNDTQNQLAEGDIVETPELVLQIATYKELKMIKAKSVLVLGSQTIADFVDAIDCTMDLAICWEDNSENPLLKGADWSSKIRESCALYIGDTIYVDRRNLGHQDYSMEIIKFLDMHSDSLQRGLEPIKKVGDMSTTKFIDLELNIGLPYVFIHQGSCEHLIVVEQIRLYHPGDDPRVANYPRQIFRGGPRRMSCHVCADKLARWITFNDEEAPSSPCWFCFECFWMLHYTGEGEKLHEFNAYVYLENMEDRIGFQAAFQKFRETISVDKRTNIKTEDPTQLRSVKSEKMDAS